MNRKIKPFSAPDCAAFVSQNLSRIKNEELRIETEAAWIPHFTENTLSVLAKYGDAQTRERIASYEKTPVSILQILTEEDSPDIRMALASNTGASESVLRLLAMDRDDAVRLAVARNSHTPKDILRNLCMQSPMLWGLAQNPNTPKDILELLARNSNPHIRKEVAHNPDTPVFILQALAADPVVNVRNQVALNPATPDSVLKILAKESCTSAACNPARSARKQIKERKRNSPGFIGRILLFLIIIPFIRAAKLMTVFRKKESEIGLHNGMENMEI
ncbi:MAG: hypothetical protein AB7S75_19555 [Desulfococcaceae bacterium]